MTGLAPRRTRGQLACSGANGVVKRNHGVYDRSHRADVRLAAQRRKLRWKLASRTHATDVSEVSLYALPLSRLRQQSRRRSPCLLTTTRLSTSTASTRSWKNRPPTTLRSSTLVSHRPRSSAS